MFAPPQLVLAAAEAFDGAHPLSIVTIPALLSTADEAGVDPTVSSVAFGSTEESRLLQRYFALPRPPKADRPYFAPWSKDPGWQNLKYPGGALQRQRNHLMNQGVVLVQSKIGGGRDSWSLTPNAGAELLAKQGQPVRLVDLALWFGRNVDTSALDPSVIGSAATELDKLIAWFVHEFAVDKGDLIGTIYSTDVPAEYYGAEFVDAPVDEGTYELLGSLPPAPVVNSSLTELVASLEHRLTTSGYVLPPGLVRRVLIAWMRGDIVVLMGQPGTGKSLFANLLGRAMEAELDLDAPLVVPIRADFDEAEFIGYERLDGSPEYRDFTRVVLETEDPLEARVVILEEFNLAAIETYLSSVLVATQDQERLIRLPAGGEAQLPIDTFIIATCNSYRDEPETRTRVSSPTKRRSTVITMPNILGDLYDEDPNGAVLKLAIQLIETERARVETRGGRGAVAQFDGLRLANLSTLTGLSSLSAEVQESLRNVANAILDTPSGRSWFTMGILRDVALNIAHADRDKDAELLALGESVADKLVHQLRGSFSEVEDLRAACAELPNAAEIDRLIERMMDGPSDELLTLL